MLETVFIASSAGIHVGSCSTSAVHAPSALSRSSTHPCGTVCSPDSDPSTHTSQTAGRLGEVPKKLIKTAAYLLCNITYVFNFLGTGPRRRPWSLVIEATNNGVTCFFLLRRSEASPVRPSCSPISRARCWGAVLEPFVG